MKTIKHVYYQRSKVGMHNIRPEGQMWPAEACNPDCGTPNLVYFTFFFEKNIF